MSLVQTVSLSLELEAKGCVLLSLLRSYLNRFFLDSTKSRNPIGMGYIDSLNNELLAYMNSFSRAEIAKRLGPVSVSSLQSKEERDRASRILKQYGIVVVPSFVERNSALRLGQESQKIIDNYVEALSGSGQASYEDNEALVQLGPVRLKGYRQLVDYKKAVVHTRVGQDKGMVDVFNINRLLSSEFSNLLKESFSQELLSDVFHEADIGNLQDSNLNVYLNRGVSKTRGFHIDSPKEQLKSFIYLTDVESLELGPYSYSLGSHCCDESIGMNRAFSSATNAGTESPLVKLSSIVPVLGRAGTLVISDQRGIHRGLPQDSDALRLVAVMNYKPTTRQAQ